ncbi:two-component system CheB/CheR fusion protein [Leeuwenhoekiella aestuarii]|uniref:Two-component system CheB/CheR fusion protein n=1 Tax=Leeuwenhoekiella aestuarii TaxID=2249426 RepID=A0A4Q0NY69_9FLAO|nr:chemotaxis protein CheB [Leeuwenhoekiella aestuarii]RXG15710.1 two-component system CheB/CheR fusion protein [Leeuwenhoekiella aestuarii]RXG17181.1 two-component system CheB/CheR fusion protein [Leeuwenhoekiella aestuarii]
MTTNTTFKKATHVVVGIGASAGGLQALNDFFDNVPTASLYSYIVVQHLSPDHKSLMAELLAKNTKIPIEVIKDGGEIKANCIYLIPPTHNLVIEEGKFKLLEKPKDKSLNLPIDMFFESLANHAKEHCAGIILSGTGSDGSRGIRAIKEKGGVVMVQQPEQAKFDGMPRNSIKTGLADFIVPVERISDELSNYFEAQSSIGFDAELFQYDEKLLTDILTVLKNNTALDFSLYKRPTLLRRIGRRVRVLKLDSLEAYFNYLKNNTEEVQTLYNEFLIGVTKFFRDFKVWEILENDIIPEIVSDKEDGAIIKIWDVGCSTGEEPYSLGILFLDEIKKQGKDISLKIFATDISQDHLDIASKGLYSENVLSDLSSDRINTYFRKSGDNFIVKENIRKCIIFSNHDITNDPPFKNMDMVMCRNLLIYLQNEVQSKVIHLLHYALIQDGILTLGSSESLGVHKNSFEEINRKWNVYRNIENSERLKTEILSSTAERQSLKRNTIGTKKGSVQSISNTSRLKEEISKAIMQQYGAASVYIDENFHILEALGAFKKYVQFPEEGFTTNLIDMLSEELSEAIKNTVNKARRRKSQILYKDVEIFDENNELKKRVDVLVKPVKSINLEGDFHYIITLIEIDKNENKSVIIERADIHKSAQERIKDLEDELKETQYELSNALEEAETSNEELQASNEELLASNEELQSTNEELQSVNEELHTVNAEHIEKMEDLAMLNADMDNLLDSTRIGTVFLDKNLIIRKFTPAIREHFHLVKQDIGRSIENFVANFGIRKRTTIVDNSKKVMNTGQVFEKRIKSKSGRYFLQRISPFHTGQDSIEGVVITFIDIHKVEQSQARLRKSEEKFKAFYEDDPVMHVTINSHTGLISECNGLFVETLGFESKTEVVGKSIFEFYPKQTKVKAIALLDELEKTGSISNEELKLECINGDRLDVLFNAELMLNAAGDTNQWRCTLMEITDLKIAQQELQKQKDDLERINTDLEQFVSICSHDLQEPLSTIRFSSDFLSKKFSDEMSEKGKEYLGYIHEASGRMAEQIKALLEHSRIGEDLKKTKVDVTELIEIVKYDLNRSIREANATVSVGKMPVLMAYETELRLLFQNLISNALKYRQKGVKPSIRISSFGDEEYQTFAIADNGIGIKEDDLEAIFKIFGRVPTEEKYEGTGVGLAHCKKIVKLHEGTIWVDSQFGQGSTFYFKIKR